jgi:stage V sporulation protein SpoVS
MSTIPELKVSAKTIPSKLGGAIVKYLEETPKISVMAMGGSAISQAVKGIIVAQSYLASSGIDFAIKPGFKSTEDNGEHKTIIVFFLTRNW